MEGSVLRKRRAEEDDVDETAPLLLSQDRARDRPPSPRNVPPAAKENPIVAFTAQPTIYDMIMRVVSSFLDSISSFFVPSPQEAPCVLDDETKSRMAEFKEHLSQKFDISNPRHAESLKTLWKFGFGEDSIFPADIVSVDWKKLGFQSDDPQRDFRATGIYGVRNILFLAEKYPQSFRRFTNLDGARKVEVYPFAITCFNLTMMVMELLGWGWKSKTSTAKMRNTYAKCVRIVFAKNHSKEANDNAFCEIFCLALYLLDKTWLDSNATYMEFPNILIKTQEALEKDLNESQSLAEVLEKNGSRLS